VVANSSDMDWHDVACCDFCGGVDQNLYMESRTPRWYGERALRLVRCDGCGLVFVSPRPDLTQLYSHYLAGDDDAKSVLERKLKRTNVRDIHRKHVEAAIKYFGRTPKRLFDMGCGAGTTLMAARELGIETWGNDVNKAAVNMLRGDGHNVHLGFTNELDLPTNYFDIVLNFDYLEHSYSPMADLRTCFDLLPAGGVMYLKTLYLDCPSHREKGEAWQLFGIGHFYFFTPEMLLSMIKACGFEVLDVKKGQLIFVAARRPPA
jgi:2-polyprenyl-3-methyl-5-hydroxy-6-metoxy-1,4-benzoquinol methylase